jgi:hypothetical protein
VKARPAQARQAPGALAPAEAAGDKENSDPQQQGRRQSREAAASKRQAIYGVLFGNRPAPAASHKPTALNANKEVAR